MSLQNIVNNVRKKFADTAIKVIKRPALAVELQQYERYERAEHRDHIGTIEHAQAAGMAAKKLGREGSIPGEAIRYNPRLQHLKNKTQRKNWHKWKTRF